MKKFFLIIIFVTFCLPGLFSQVGTNKINPNGYNVFYYPNGVKSSEGYMRDGKPDGYWINYYPTGRKKSEGNRKNFLLDSVWIFYNEQGDTTEKITYYLGKKNGWYYIYYTRLDGYKNNRVKSKILYVDDKREGPGYFYYPDGKLWKIINFRSNRPHGLAFEYAKDGRIINVISYRYGNPVETQAINRYDSLGQKNGLWREYYDNGQIKWEATYKHGKLDGYYKEYNQFGTLVKYLRYKNGQLIKEAPDVKEKEQGNLRMVEKYYPNGKIKFIGAYSDTIPVGIHKFYNPDGTIAKAVWYNDLGIKIGEGMVDTAGRKIGTWKLFYEDGNLMAQGNFINDKRTGQWKFYYKSGKLQQIGNYLNGKPEGKWTWYYPNGNILRVEYFADGLRNGPYFELSPQGDTIVTTSYTEGQLYGKWKFQLGDYLEIGQYELGRRQGQWKSYYMPEKHIMCIDNYEDGYREGTHKCFYPNKKLKEKGNFVSDKKNGIWYYYNDKGYLIYTITYNFGEAVKVDGKKLENGQE